MIHVSERPMRYLTIEHDDRDGDPTLSFMGVPILTDDEYQEVLRNWLEERDIGP